MRSPDQSDLESMIAAAEAEAMESLRAAPAPDRYPALRASRDRISAIVTDALARIDVDGSELDRLQREHNAELRRIAEDAKRDAIERSEEASRRLEAAVKSQRDALDVLPDDPFGPDTHLLLSALSSDRRRPRGTYRSSPVPVTGTAAIPQATGLRGLGAVARKHEPL